MAFKQTLIYFILTLFVILGSKYAHMLIFYINAGLSYCNGALTPYLANEWLRKVLLLLGLPTLIIGVPALLYRGIKGKTMPYFTESIWIVWMILTLCFLMNK